MRYGFQRFYAADVENPLCRPIIRALVGRRGIGGSFAATRRDHQHRARLAFGRADSCGWFAGCCRLGLIDVWAALGLGCGPSRASRQCRGLRAKCLLCMGDCLGQPQEGRGEGQGKVWTGDRGASNSEGLSPVADEGHLDGVVVGLSDRGWRDSRRRVLRRFGCNTAGPDGGTADLADGLGETVRKLGKSREGGVAELRH